MQGRAASWRSTACVAEALGTARVSVMTWLSHEAKTGETKHVRASFVNLPEPEALTSCWRAGSLRFMPSSPNSHRLFSGKSPIGPAASPCTLNTLSVSPLPPTLPPFSCLHQLSTLLGFRSFSKEPSLRAKEAKHRASA
jgi:hypothetical protein